MSAVSEVERWDDAAVCRTIGSDMWFIDTKDRTRETVVAKKVCASCPVLDYCRVASFAERYGTWAAMSEDDRSRLRRQLNAYVPETETQLFHRAADAAWRMRNPIKALAALIGYRAATGWIEWRAANARHAA